MTSKPPSNPTSSRLPLTSKVDLQTIEDFLRENPAPAPPVNHAQQPQPKKQKNRTEPDEDVVQAERQAMDELGNGVNWVGRLQEYRYAHPVRPQPTTITSPSIAAPSPLEVSYTESAITHHLLPRFLSAVQIAEHPFPFASPISFSTKRTAKQYAAKLAVDWLVAHGYMPGDGSVKFPRTIAPPAAFSSSSSSSSGPSIPGPNTNTTGSGERISNKNNIHGNFPSQIPGLCQRLGLQPPKYVLEKVAGTDNLWDIYATFGGNSRCEARIGEMKGVFGKASAKQFCAYEVRKYLNRLEMERLNIPILADKEFKNAVEQNTQLLVDGKGKAGGEEIEDDDAAEVFYDA